MSEIASTESSQSSRRSPQGTDLVTDQGRTVITDTVVAKIVGLATRDVAGVHDVGSGMSRMAGAVRERIPGSTTNHAQGVTVEVGEQQAAADIDIIADYGVPLADLGASIRRNVITSVERMTGLEVVEVNVTVHDLHVETGSDDGDQQQHARVS